MAFIGSNFVPSTLYNGFRITKILAWKIKNVKKG